MRVDGMIGGLAGALPPVQMWKSELGERLGWQDVEIRILGFPG